MLLRDAAQEKDGRGAEGFAYPRRIEGQIRGLEKMVENDAYCPDILVQSSAATSALNSFNKVLLGCHLRSCVAEDIRAGKDETVDELCELLQRLMK